VPRPRFFRLPEDKRLALLRVAAEEFAREGFFGASYNRVIEQGPLGKSSAYLAFDDKEDLFFTVLRHRLPPLQGPVPETLNDAADFWPAVGDWIRRFGEHALEDPLVLPLAASFYALLPSSARGQALEGDVLAFVGRFIERGRSLGVVRRDLSSETLSALAVGGLKTLDKLAIASATSPSADAPTAEDLQRWIDLSVDLLRRILSPAPPTRVEEVS
jgi:AcrR family transcriptional regulator